MNFDSIVLTAKQEKRLKEIAKAPEGLPNIPEDAALYNQHLIHCDFLQPKPRNSVVTEKGKAYLIKLERSRKEKASDRFHNWLVAIFSVIAGAALSRPLWETIDWLLGIIARLR